ncbi:MAG: hypothetical protein ACRD0F_07950 [Acidimicrobiales bacterium]
MIGGWLLKIVIGIAAAGLLVIELGSPLVARAQADDAAHEVADEAAFELGQRADAERVQAKCEEIAAKKSVTLVRCEIVDNAVDVTVHKTALSLFFSRFSFAEDWYEIDAKATGRPPR